MFSLLTTDDRWLRFGIGSKGFKAYSGSSRAIRFTRQNIQPKSFRGMSPHGRVRRMKQCNGPSNYTAYGHESDFKSNSGETDPAS